MYGTLKHGLAPAGVMFPLVSFSGMGILWSLVFALTVFAATSAMLTLLPRKES
ncbi:MAG: hypothetical protein ACXVXO_12745 [Mycobacteriaceae bacterium]